MRCEPPAAHVRHLTRWRGPQPLAREVHDLRPLTNLSRNGRAVKHHESNVYSHLDPMAAAKLQRTDKGRTIVQTSNFRRCAPMNSNRQSCRRFSLLWLVSRLFGDHEFDLKDFTIVGRFRWTKRNNIFVAIRHADFRSATLSAHKPTSSKAIASTHTLGFGHKAHRILMW